MWFIMQITIMSGAVVGCAFAYAILQPLVKVPKRGKGKTQYFLSDLFSLLLLLQIPLVLFAVLAYWHPHDFSTGDVAFAVAYNSLGVALVWWLAVRFLSRRGILGAFPRTVFIVIILPVAILGAWALCGSVTAGLLTLLGLASFPATSPVKLRIWAAVLMIPFLCYPFRKLTSWVVSGAKRP